MTCSGLIVATWTIYLIANPTKYALAVVLFFVTFVTGQLLLSRSRTQTVVNIPNHYLDLVHRYSGDLIAVSLVISAFLVALIPPIDGELYITFGKLPPLSVVRLVAAFSLNFLPGYIILTIVDWREKLRGLSKFVTSYLLSLLLITIMGFICARISGIIHSLYLTSFLVTNTMLVSIYFFLRLRKFYSSRVPPTLHTKRNVAYWIPSLLVVLAVAFQCVWMFGALEKVGFFIGGPGSDQWRLHGFAQSFLDGRAFIWLHVPWWFHIYLASFTTISGVPSVNAYVALHPFIIMSKLAFYVMASSLLKNRKIAALGTLAYTIFSGSAWLYALNLRGYALITNYDSWIGILWQTGGKFLYEGWYPPFTIGFVASDLAYTCLWWLIYSTCHLDLRRRFNFILTSTILALSYLVHGVEPMIFVLFLVSLLVIYSLTKNTDGMKKARLAVLCVVAGLAIVALIEVSLSDYYLVSNYPRYTRYDFPNYYYFNTPHFYLSATMAGIALVLSFAELNKKHLKSRFEITIKKPRFTATLERIKKLFIIALFCVYALSLVIWIRVISTFNSANIGTGSVPWYAYSATGGVPFLLGLIGIAYLVLRRNRWKMKAKEGLVFSLVSILLLFLFGRVVSLVNLYYFETGFWERRVLPYMHAMISIIMAFALFAIVRQKRVEKPSSWRRLALVSSLVSIVTLSSVSTALVALDFTTRNEVLAPSPEELEALTYLHYSIPVGSKTAYLSQRTGTYYIRGFANDKWTYDYRLWMGGYPTSPEIILKYIGGGNVRYLYLHHTRDNETLQKNLFAQQMLRILPKVFENSEVTIYAIPPLHPPQGSSNMGLMPYNSTIDASYNAYVLWLATFAVSNYSFALMQTNFERSQVLISPFDPPKYGTEVAGLWEWVGNGGHLIVSNTNFYGVFSEFMGITPRLNLISCDSTEDWDTLYGRGKYLVDNSTKVEGASSLRMVNKEKTGQYDGSWEEWIYTIPDRPWDLSDYEYLGIYVYNTGTSTSWTPMGPQWYIHLYDSNGNRSYPSYRYDLSKRVSEDAFQSNFNGWRLHLIPIREYFQNVDLSKIKELRIATGFQLPVEILIDDIFALKTNPIVTANSIIGKEVVDLPTQLMVPDIRLSTDVISVANYTLDGIIVAPFAVQKNFGAGKITYVNINSVYEYVLFESSEVLFPDKLVEILESLNIEMQSYD